MINLTPRATLLQFEQSDLVEKWEKTFAAHGGLDIKSGAFTPLREVQHMLADEDSCAVNYVLDAIAGAAEFGSVELTAYAHFEALFAEPKEIPEFLEALDNYSESYWLNERHFRTFNSLIEDESQCNSYQAIANWLEENAE